MQHIYLSGLGPFWLQAKVALFGLALANSGG
jgi:hypothetical protein